MAKRATMTLDTFKASKEPHLRPVPPTESEPVRKGQTLRLEPAAWQQLKILGIEQQRPAHALLVEAVNLLFERYEKPPIAR